MEITGNVEEGTNPDRGVDNVVLLCLEMSALFQDVAHQTNTLVHRDVRYGHMCKKCIRQDCQLHSSTCC